MVSRSGTHLVFAAPVAAALLLAAPVTTGAVLDRRWDPVLITGEAIPQLHGIEPGRLVAFRYEGDWVQIPVQVDERAVVDFGTIYNLDPTGYTVLTYADTSTFTGPDPEPTLDADDEIVLMASETGEISMAAVEPAGTLAGTGMELTITDPLTGETAYAYLFESDGSIDPGAGAHPVSYVFDLLSGDYKSTYNTLSGPNPENSVVTTDSYGLHFSDRWIRDETWITAEGATGEDILDRHKALFAPGNCMRSEDTFSAGEGAFIINREGPVRALRGYVGANSGPTTYRIHAFYAMREEILTALRVHPISGIMDFFDYSPDATGMVFRNDLNPDGVVIDGVNDSVVPGQFIWEMVCGGQGTLVMTLGITTDIPGFDYSSYYLDDVTPPDHQCTGDAYAYGSSGFWEEDNIPNTDPGVSETYFVFEATRTMVFASPDQPASFAQARAQEALNPLTVTAEPYVPSSVSVHRAVEAPTPGLVEVFCTPNPFSDELRVGLQLRAAGRISIRLYRVTGQLVREAAIGWRDRGRQVISIDTSGLASGVYVVTAAEPGGESAASRVVVLR